MLLNIFTREVNEAIIGHVLFTSYKASVFCCANAGFGFGKIFCMCWLMHGCHCTMSLQHMPILHVREAMSVGLKIRDWKRLRKPHCYISFFDLWKCRHDSRQQCAATNKAQWRRQLQLCIYIVHPKSIWELSRLHIQMLYSSVWF